MFRNIHETPLEHLKESAEYPYQWVTVITISILLGIFSNCLFDLEYILHNKNTIYTHKLITLSLLIIILFFLTNNYIQFVLRLQGLNSLARSPRISLIRKTYKDATKEVRSISKSIIRILFLFIFFSLLSIYKVDDASFLEKITNPNFITNDIKFITDTKVFFWGASSFSLSIFFLEIPLWISIQYFHGFLADPGKFDDL